MMDSLVFQGARAQKAFLAEYRAGAGLPLAPLASALARLSPRSRRGAGRARRAAAILIAALHATITSSAFFAGDLIGFTTGLLITVLLLVLTLRAAKLPGTPRANIVFAACAFLWSAGGLADAALLGAAIPAERWRLAAQAVQFCGVAAFPIPVLAIWRAPRLLRISACICAIVLAVLLWSPVSPTAVTRSTAYNAALWLVLGAAASLRRDSTPRTVYLPSLAIVAAVCGATLTLALASHAHGGHTGAASLLAGIGGHLVLLGVLCAFLLFARFRFADVFIRYGVRILLAGVWVTVLTFIAQSWFLLNLAHRAASPAAAHVFLVLFFANLLMLSFTFVDERISTRLNRWLFHTPDYRAETRQLANRLRQLPLESEIAAAVEEAARRPLELSGARVVPVDGAPAISWPAGVQEGETVELEYGDPLRKGLPLANVEVLVPISSAGRVTHLLLVAPGPNRPGLVTLDLNYLGAVAAQCGQRFDALRREREAVERQSREALLVQQVTEAELRALRAQVNPHFLFNSLNTIADQIVRDPVRAETMTLRLASVFRHVLAHSCRPLTSIRDEMEFLRTYLYIEEARFGDRLQVEIDMAPEIADESIPSLILQPLVENALKHGLGPKPGPGHLWISAQAENGKMRLRVEDDGVGPGVSSRAPRGTPGLGLSNIAERLNTLYHEEAGIRLEAREGGGSRVTVTIPRSPSGETA